MKTKSATIRNCVAALAFEASPTGGLMQLLPAGEFRSRDGRPKNVPNWKLDATIAARVIAKSSERQTPFVVDYEHQTLLAEENGLPAPAAGWWKQLEWREGQGLFATDIEWTERAAGFIAAKEYRFQSAVFSYDKKTGEVLEILHASLTNTPALDGLSEVAALAAAKFSVAPLTTDQPEEESPMNPLLKLMLAALGLQETATEVEATAALSALKTKADKSGELETEIVALKSKNPDPAKFVPVETMQALQTQVAALSSAVNGRELDEVVRGALDAGKLLPAQEGWARDLGKKDIAALKSYVDTAQPIAALLNSQTNGNGGKVVNGQSQQSDVDLAVMKALGQTAEQFAAGKVEA